MNSRKIFIIITAILFAGCKKIIYHNFKLQNIRLNAMPFQDANSQDWDYLSGPDVFYNIEDAAGRVLLSGSNGRVNDISDTDLPLSWDLQTGYEINDFEAVQFITVYDYDPLDPNDKIGDVGFKLKDYSSSYPKNITKTSGGLSITITGQWY